MVGGHTCLEEVLDVAFNGGVLMDELLVIPDRTIDLRRTVEFRTPGTILNEGLLSVPSLSELVLELGQCRHPSPLHATIIADGEVACPIGLATLGGDDDDTVGSAATIECGGCSTFQHGHRLNVGAVDVGYTTHGLLLTLLELCSLLEGYTIDDIQRLVVAIDGAETTDDHGVGRARVRRTSIHLHTSHLASE